MKKYIALLLIISTLSSCNEPKIKISTINHLDYLGLIGKVKKVDVTITTNELKGSNYIPMVKGDKNNIAEFTRDLAILFGKRIGVESLFQPENYYDANAILFNSIGLPLDYRNTKYHLSFNKYGYLEKLSGFKNGKLQLEKKWKYDDKNRLIELTFSSDGFGDKGGYGAIIYSYNYNDDNFVIAKSLKWDDGTTKKFVYTYKDQNDAIQVIEKKDNEEYGRALIYLNENKLIEKIENKSGELKFNNLNIREDIQYDENGKISTNYEYFYENGNIVEVKETKRFDSDDSPHFNKYEYKYNDQGFVYSLKSDTDNFAQDVIYNYNFDGYSNWTNLKFQLDKKYFLEAQEQVNRLEARRKRIASRLSGREAIRFALDDREVVMAEYNKNLIEMKSAQLEIKRDISYFKD